MPEPIHIPLSPFQQKHFAALLAQEQAVASARSAMVTAIIAGSHDPESLKAYVIEVRDAAIVCTPPAE